MRPLLLVLHLILGISALGAGQALIFDTDGSNVGLDADYLAGSPFGSYLVPGLFLFFVNGGLNLASAAAWWRRTWWAPMLSLVAGVVLMVWLAIQWSIIGSQHWTQWLWLVIFSTVTVAAAIECRGKSDDLRRRLDLLRAGLADRSVTG